MTPMTIDEQALAARPSSWHAALSQLPGFNAVSLWEESEESLDELLPEAPEVDVAGLDELEDELFEEGFRDDDELDLEDEEFDPEDE